MTDRTEELLDYVHDRLDPPARKAFERDLAQDAELQAELATVEAIKRDFAARVPSADTRAVGWDRLSQAIDAEQPRVAANDDRRLTLLQAAAIVLVAVLATQFLTVQMLSRGAQDGFAPASVAAEPIALQVGFAPGATIAEIAALLAEVDAQLVDGPSAIGLISLGFADEATRDSAVQVLEARPDLVDLVAGP